MTKTVTDARRLVLPALGAGAALSAMLFASRLPVTLDFILPRRAGWPLFVLGYEALSRSGPRGLFTGAVSLALLGGLGRFAWLAAAVARARKWSVPDFLYRGFALALVLFLTRGSFAVWFEVSQKVWFPFGSMNALEPFANVLACSALAFVAMAGTLACLSPRPGLAKGLLAWAAANGCAALLALSVYGAWTAFPSAPADSRRLFVVLTEEEGRPAQAAYDLPVSAPPLRPAYAAVRLESLRARYEAEAKLMDPAGLRAALLLGVEAGDDLARAVLLAHLSAAPPSAEALGALGTLADETAHRVGPMGAVRIALAYAHLGDAAQAAVWAKRGEAGPRGIPAGLLDLSGGGALKPGRIAGRVEGLRPLKIALYRKSDPAAPYLLDASGLVASTEADMKGRFSFSGLTAGRYYLAFAFEPRGAEIRASGQRGDLTLDSRRTSIEVPPLTFKRL